MTKARGGSKESIFSSTDLLIYIWKRRIPLGIITTVAAIISTLASLSVTPKFRSSVIMFPTSSISVMKNLDRDIYEIGDEDHSEQLMQILSSEEIKSRIIQKYDLMNHYGIDSLSSFPLTRINSEYYSNISFRRTEYMSVMVEVMDKNPQMAADIANDISSLADTVYNTMLRQRSVEIYRLMEAEFNEAFAGFQKMKDSLDVLSSFGINNYIAQSDRYHEAYGNALVSGNSEAIKVLENKLKIMSKYGGTYQAFSNQMIIESERISKLKQALLEAKVEAEQTLPHKFIVQKAFKAEKKAYPNKSLIVIISTLSAFLVGLILLLISDNLKQSLK